MKSLLPALALLSILLFCCSSPPQPWPRTVVDEARRACTVYAEQNELEPACDTLEHLRPFLEALLRSYLEKEGALDGGLDDGSESSDSGP